MVSRFFINLAPPQYFDSVDGGPFHHERPQFLTKLADDRPSSCVSCAAK